MGTELRGGGPGARGSALRIAGVSAGCGVLLLAGCAGMPTSGEIRSVKASPRADSQVRVEAVPPRKGATPHQVVEGFLEAMTSDDANFATAREYLTEGMAKTWRPEAGTAVLAEAPVPGQAREGGPTAQEIDYPLHGRQIARVDEQLAYEATTPTEYQRTIHLTRQKGADGQEWRIDRLPPGLVLGASDFQRNYRPVNKYYFAAGRNTVVADPVFIRQRMDPVTQTDPLTQSVKALLDGPSAWLDPVVESAFPKGTRLKKDAPLTFDDRNTLEVPFNEKANGVSRAQCDRMAAQILLTLKDLSSSRVDQVELQRANGAMLCVLSSGTEEAYRPGPSRPVPGHQYVVDGRNRLAVLPKDGQGTPEPVRGPLGEERVPLGRIAVARDEDTAAAVSKDGRELLVAPIGAETAEEPGHAPVLVRSRGAAPANRLSAPSWDGLGDLWVADRDPVHGGLLRFAGGEGKPQPVRIVPDPGEARIESVRLSADGTRIALLLTRDGRTTLQIGRVERLGSADDPVVRITALRPAAPQMETVTAVSWAGPSRLVVVGEEAGEVQQVRYIQTDGSSSADSVLPGLNSVLAVAASDDERMPLVAHSEGEGIVRLPSGANWQKVVTEGSSPVYPG
ncbi:LpqB family beta-propeller domain-containing protein [Streptomyces yaizuensis]|uniref:LpqB family beta-propeller domain-containing protein n=1 Tax=Streptomyces yaizuensis TaxID=2989713 RepID=A0ABQ5NTD6_9ACTN|nr:LpqB family beta-propeller domain-containing protein [Streptomyces sp. YSPA8]GLF93413.1 LpqB family beta-propeller domain-containing protein [Streptomyces sp. YSPA8]